MGQWGLEAHCILAKLMKCGAHPSPFAAFSFPDSKKIPIYCWVDTVTYIYICVFIGHWLTKRVFPAVGWQNLGAISRPSGDFLHHYRVTLSTTSVLLAVFISRFYKYLITMSIYFLPSVKFQDDWMRNEKAAI